MIITGTTVSNNTISLSAFLSININMEETVPADSLILEIPFIKKIEELREITIKKDEKYLFKGIVDEQSYIYSNNSTSKGAHIKIVARSMAALLLDNEAKPQSYFLPTKEIIYKKHVEPFNIKNGSVEDKTYNNTMNILKGTTNWQVVEGFCKNLFNSFPRVDSSGTLYMEGTNNEKEIFFSNFNRGNNYIYIKENLKRCAEISEIRAKTDLNGDYDYIIKNEDAINREITKIRYLDTTLLNVPIISGEKIIKQGKNNNYTVKLVCPYEIINVLGTKAKIEDNNIGVINNLYISKINYTLNSSGEKTTLLLKRKEE